MVRFGGSKYSVPPQFAGQVVQVYASGGQNRDPFGRLRDRRARRGRSLVGNRSSAKNTWRNFGKITAQQVEPPPDRPRWNIEFSNDVEQVPLILASSNFSTCRCFWRKADQ